QIMAKNSADQNMQHLRANQSVNIRVDSSGQVTDVQFFTDEELERNLVALEKVKGKWQLSTSEVDMKVMPTLRSIVVRTSARGAMAQAEIPVEIRESLSEIFSDVLSLEELQEGDVVRLLYNNMYFRGQQMGTGDILAAEIVKGGKTYQAYYYSQGKGDEESGSYYDQNGKSLQQKE
ncbi:peptidase M23, partial [Neisseria sp. P0021.S007]